MTDTTVAVEPFAAAWRKWRTERIASLRAPDGPPTLFATHWLDDTDEIPGVPGHWSTRDGETVLALPTGASAVEESETLTGDVVALPAGAEIGPRIHLPALTAQVTTRLGRRGVRIFDHARADAVADVDTFEPSPAWVIPAEYKPLSDAATLEYGFALESGPRDVPVPGEVAFELGGRRYTTKPFMDEGRLLLVFADRTTGDQTKPPSRFLLIDPPRGGIDSAAGLTLDFNRAFLPPCAFSEEFNCPLPPAGHRFEIPVIAGERWVRWSS